MSGYNEYISKLARSHVLSHNYVRGSKEEDERREQNYLDRRLRQRKRAAAGLTADAGIGTTGKYHIPSPRAVNRGVETKRAKGVRVTLATTNIPEP